MNMRLTLVVGMTAAATAFAQQTLTLSLKKAVEIALTPEGSTKIALAEESIKYAEKQVTEARAAFLPDIEGNVNYQSETVNLNSFGLDFSSFVNIPGIPPINFPSLVGPFSIIDVRASVNQSIFDFSSIKRYQSVKTSEAAVKEDANAAKNQVSDQVARAYLACLRADASLKTARANVELSEALLRQASNQKDAGTGTGIEVTRAQVQLANDRQQLLVAENDRRRFVLQLLRQMGLNQDAKVEFSTELSYKPVELTSIEEELKRASDERAELHAQLKREDAARLNYGSVKAERIPSVGAFANYGTTGNVDIGSLPTRSVGLSLKVPIFDGGRREARRGESASQWRQEQIRTRDLKQQIELEVRTSLDSIKSAANQVTTAREGLSLSENELAQARRRYQAGVGTSIEVTDAQTRLDRARDNLISALYNYNLARLDLAAATGTISEYVNQ